MAEDKQPVEKAVELFVYAPVGVALYVRFGDWVVLLSAVAMLVVTVIAIRRPAIRPPAA